MSGIRITKKVNPEIKRKLGFEHIAKLSFMWGVPYPLPNWYDTLSNTKKKLWMIYCRIGDFFMLLLFTTNIIEIFKEYHDIRVFVTCTGTLTYIICFRIKMQIYKKHAKTIEKVIDSLHKITENLENNSVNDKDFFKMYNEHFKHVISFGKGKILAIGGGVCTLAVFEMIHGYIQDSPTKRNLPMFGWYPYDPYDLFFFEVTCVFQLISYCSFLLKDVVVDLFFLTILVIINTHLVYLRKLLGYIVKLNEDRGGILYPPEDSKIELRWWVRNHQIILRTIEDFKEITNPYLFYKYISVGIILFFGGVLVTSNTEYDLIQQMIVLAINSSNLLQLYIFSVIGDEITENGTRVIENGLHINTILNSHPLRTSYLFIATRCSKLILIHFGQINPLCVASFAQIVKLTFSYFITIVQIRDKALVDDTAILFLNFTK